MDRFLEYLNHHPWLAGGTLLVVFIAAGFELRARRRGATAISSNQAIALHNKGALVLDVRSAEEFAAGHIVNARHLPPEEVDKQADSLKKYRDKPIIVCCETGVRSAQAVKQLQAQGYTTVFNLSGGLSAWRQENLPLSKPAKAANSKKVQAS